MGVANYLAGLRLDPKAAAALHGVAGLPPPANNDVNGDAPMAEEMQRYGATPREVAVGTAANTAAGSGAANVASPTAQPGWSPDQQEKREADAKAAEDTDGPQAGLEGGGEEEAPPQRPGVYVPAHWQPSSRSEAVRYGMDPNALAPARSAMESATAHGAAAGEKRLEAAQQEGIADAVYAAAHAQASKTAAEQMQRLDDEKRAFMAREGEKLDQLSLAAQQKVDPDAAKGSAGAQLFGAIGIALGAFGASVNGGQNTALQIVNANIDRNIRAQETNIANAKQTLKDQQSLYRQNLDAFGDKERAVLATKMQYLEQVKAMGDMQYAAAKHTMNEADKHAWDQKLLEQSAEWQKEFAKLTSDVHEANQADRFVPGQTVGGGGGPKKDLPNLVTLSDGTTVQMPNEKQQDKAIEKIQVIDRLQRYNNEALRVRKQIAGATPLSGEYNKLHKQLEDLEETKASLLSTDAGQGVLRDSEYARAVGRQGFYTEGVGIFKGNPIAAARREAADANLRRQIQRGNEDQRAFVRAAGGHIVERGYTRDEAGQRAPAARYTGQDLQPVQQLAPRGFTPLKKGDANVPTADAPLGEITPDAEDFGFQSSSSGGGGGKKGGKGPHVKARK